MERTDGSKIGRKELMHMREVQGYPYPMGVTIKKDRTNFAAAVPKGKPCQLLIYKIGRKEPEYEFDLPGEKAVGEVRFLALEGFDPSEYEYLYRVEEKLWIDPYVKKLTGHRVFGQKEDFQAGQIRGKAGAGEFDWGEDTRLLIPYHEVIAYSLHVRGFTMHSSSRVKHKGTFLGVAEKIPYLKELGINQIQCMPVYEFEEYNGNYQNYWGYGKGRYFAPKAAYSASGCASRELKEMVKACHSAGIEVVLEMPFTPGILPQMALECLQYYMLEYHIDGFVVNPYNVPWEMLIKDPLLKGVKIMKKEDGFQNIMRRFLKGDEGMVNDVIWALRHNTKEDGCCNYITTHTGFTLADLVSYDGKHNEANGEQNQDGPVYNYSWNCGVEGPSRKKSVVELRRNQMKNAMFLLLMAQGTPCLLAGDEFGNTQNGNNNVYCQDNELSWLNWNKLKTQDSFFQYVKALIALRRAHPVLHRSDILSGLDQTACGTPDVSYHGENAWRIPAEIASRQLGILYSGSEMKDEDCFIAYNMHWEKHSFALPNLGKKKKWHQVMETREGVLTEERLLEDQKMIELKPRSIVLLFGRTAADKEPKYDKVNSREEGHKRK